MKINFLKNKSQMKKLKKIKKTQKIEVNPNKSLKLVIVVMRLGPIAQKTNKKNNKANPQRKNIKG